MISLRAVRVWHRHPNLFQDHCGRNAIQHCSWYTGPDSGLWIVYRFIILASDQSRCDECPSRAIFRSDSRCVPPYEYIVPGAFTRDCRGLLMWAFPA